MQKLVYLSNSRDYTEHGDINENKYYKRINKLLDEGWTVSHITHEVVEVDTSEHPIHKETLVSIVLLEKPDEQK